MSDDFVRDLEEELVTAAQFRAQRRRRRLPRPSISLSPRLLLGALACIAALAVVAGLAALALNRGADDKAADRQTAPPPGGAVVPAVPMLTAAVCTGAEVSKQPAAGEFPDVGVFARTQHEPDAIPPPWGTWSVTSFDPAETRLAGHRRLTVRVHAFPSRGVSIDGSCGRDDGPGVCLVQTGPGRFRCFTRGQLEGGGALALTGDGIVIGMVLDGIDGVTLSAHGQTVTADVVENVYEARLPVKAGDDVRVAPAPAAGCNRAVAPQLRDRVAVLRRAPDEGLILPRAALAVLDEWRWQLDAIVEHGARFWGGGDGVEFWAVPVVPRAATGCAPATGVCIVAVLEDGRADAHNCVWGADELRKGTWTIAPLWPDAAGMYGIVPDGVTGARVTIDGQSARVDARDNVVGGKLPFPYRDAAKTDVQLLHGPEPQPAIVAVVDSTGGNRAAAERVLREIRGTGVQHVDGIVPGIKAQPRTDVYWRPGRATRGEAESVAALVGADAVRQVVRDLAPRPVLSTGAGIVVVVGSER